ncbi:hypothetical protein DPMN_106172 [Dreissena polymorpha]|uniref:Uncharacterized protein n=1 Tax=Dreissena polymorpha TaxID=45954 RepID=A0A9D4QIG5_DREPO|nr:hypothetical protein DPMN_106172 [Dreissena polymorpha]
MTRSMMTKATKKMTFMKLINVKSETPLLLRSSVAENVANHGKSQEKRSRSLHDRRALRSRHAYFEHAPNKRNGIHRCHTLTTCDGIVANKNRCRKRRNRTGSSKASWRDLHDRSKSAVKALSSVVV